MKTRCDPLFHLVSPSKRAILAALDGGREVDVHTLAREVHSSRQAVGHHLRQMITAGAVIEAIEPTGPNRPRKFYRLASAVEVEHG